MILGVMSDTHGNTPLMLQAADRLCSEHGAEHLIHLGDNWEDQEWLYMSGYPVSGVPGLWCPEYRSRRIPKSRVDTFAGMQIAYAHDIQDLPPLPPSLELLLSGHTHRACIGRIEECSYMNPGHLKRLQDRGQPASYGLIVIEPQVMHLSLHYLDGKCFEQKSVNRNVDTKE